MARTRTPSVPKHDEKWLDAVEAQIRERQLEVKYDTRDFVIGWMVEEFEKGGFFIPQYQRNFIWNDRTRFDFIESVLLGLPIPMMFFADTPSGTLEIVDGAQRMQTLVGFIQGHIAVSNLKQLPLMNGCRYSDLPRSQQLKFRSRALRCVVLEEQTTQETRQEIFRRINTKGEKARPSEIRRGAYMGPFANFVKSCATDPRFVRLCPLSESQLKRREDEERVIRFFAYSDRYKDFRHEVRDFLDQYFLESSVAFPERRMRHEFHRTMKSAESVLPYGFAKSPTSTTTPRVRFEALAVGINLALRINPAAVPGDLEWLTSKEFDQHVTTDASNSAPKLQGRIEFVRDHWLAGTLET